MTVVDLVVAWVADSVVVSVAESAAALVFGPKHIRTSQRSYNPVLSTA